jgi:hypothetical protein
MHEMPGNTEKSLKSFIGICRGGGVIAERGATNSKPFKIKIRSNEIVLICK